MCRESLHRAPFCLCLLEEIVFMLENKLNLKDMLRSKIQAALIDKEPLHRVLPVAAADNSS
jgi:restriction system protein